MKTVTLTADEAIQKMSRIYKHYSNTDMSECDWFAGRTVDDLNIINALFDCCIPILLQSKTLSRKSALYQDSKPFLNKDIGFALDDFSQTDFYNKMNKIIHHDMDLYFSSLRKKHNNNINDDNSMLVDMIKLLQIQVQQDNNNRSSGYDMQCKDINYIDYLKSNMFSKNISVSSFIKKTLGVTLAFKNNHLVINTENNKLYTHKNLLKLLSQLQVKLQ